MAKKTAKRKAAGASRKASPKVQKKARAGGAGKQKAGARKPAGRKTASAKGTKKKSARPAASTKRKTAPAASRPARKAAAAPVKGSRKREGGSGREETLSQTPETGRSVSGRTNPMPTRRSTGTGAGAGGTSEAPGLTRARRELRKVEESVASPPSSLNLDRRPSAARSGRHELQETRLEHNEVSPEITAGDVDADWESAYATGDEAPGGDNPTPDQDRVDDIGKALGVEYEDNEELKAVDKIAERDRKRWELDPASSDDYKERS
jgi:hypothetical protein